MGYGGMFKKYTYRVFIAMSAQAFAQLVSRRFTLAMTVADLCCDTTERNQR